MHFHLPKPLHGWREFVGEVGIIVIGVLIALGAEQVVETVRMHRKAADAEERIRSELISDTAQEVERVAIGRCLTQRIDKIVQGIASGRADWTDMLYARMPERPMALREIYHMPSRDWFTDAYREALVQGDLSSVNPTRRSVFAGLYKQIDELAVLNESEQELASGLAPLELNRPLTDVERNQMIATLEQLDRKNALILLVSHQNFRSLHSLGIKVSAPELFKGYRPYSWAGELAELRRRYGDCVDPSAITQYENLAIRGTTAA